MPLVIPNAQRPHSVFFATAAGGFTASKDSPYRGMAKLDCGHQNRNMSGFIFYFLVLSVVFWAVSRIDSLQSTVLSRLAITLFVSPFIAVVLGLALTVFGTNWLGFTLVFWTAILFAVPSWIAAVVVTVTDMSLSAISRGGE